MPAISLKVTHAPPGGVDHAVPGAAKPLARTSPAMIPGGNSRAVVNGTARPALSALPWRSRASVPTNSV